MTFYLIGPYYPLRGGIAQYLALLGQKLQERGHQVKVLAFRKQFPRFLFPGQTQIEISRDYIHLDSQAVFIPWNPLTWWRTFWNVKKGQPQAIIFKYWMPFFAPGYAVVCALTHWLTGVRTVFIVDNVIPHERRPGDRFFTRLAFRWVDGFMVQSETVKQDLFAWFPPAHQKEVVFVPHPIYDCYPGAELSREEACRKLNVDPSLKLLLFFGLVRHYKGLDILLKALPRVIQELGETVHLLIAGEFYEAESTYQELIEKLNLKDRVTLVNRYIPNEEVGLFFRAADLLALPYRSATQSGVIQVALHFGLPVISTRVGGLPEVVKEGECGYLVEPENPTKLAEAIVKYFIHTNGETMRRTLETKRGQYDWTEMISALEKLANP